MPAPSDTPPTNPRPPQTKTPLPRLTDRDGRGATSARRSGGSGGDASGGDGARGPFRICVADVVGLAFVAAGFVMGLRPFFDNSFFTHLATGRLILDGGIPRQDPYSFTAAGEPWVVQSWLVSTMLGAIERGFGIVGVRFFAALILAVLLGLVWRLTKPAVTLLPRLAVAGLFLVSCSPFFSPRPLLVGLVLMALALVVVTEHRDPRWLVPIMWIWANSHGSFPLGLVALGAWAAGAWLDGERTRATWRPLGWAALGTLLSVINPLGPTLLVFPVNLLGKMEILSQVIEWKSPDFTTSFARVFLVELVIGVLVLVRRPSYRIAVPFAVFAAAALLGQRNIPNAGLVFVPCLALGLARLGNVDGRERGPVPLALAGAVVAAAVLVGSTQLAEPPFDLRTYPTDALAWMAQEGLVGPSHRVATEDTVGNTLHVLYGTNAGSFFDDRYDMYPVELGRDYLRVHAGQPGWQESLDRYDVHYLLWSRTEPVAQLVATSSSWRVLYQDDKVFIACRRGDVADC